MENIFELEPHRVRQLSDEQLMKIQQVHKIEQCLIYEIYRLRDRNKFLEAAANDTVALMDMLSTDGIPSWQVAAVRDVLLKGGKIKAIKKMREMTGLSLKNAKFLVDRIDAREKERQEEVERRDREEAEKAGDVGR